VQESDVITRIGVKLKGRWPADQKEIARKVFEDIEAAIGIESATGAFKGTRVLYIGSERLGKMGVRSFAPPPPLSTILMADVVLVNAQPEYTLAHELGHVWDYRTRFDLSKGLMSDLGTWKRGGRGQEAEWRPYPIPEGYPGTPKDVGDADPRSLGKAVPYAATKGGGGGINIVATMLTKPGMEDWAESFACFLYPDYYPKYGRMGIRTGGIREKYIHKRIKRKGKKGLV
jgi:hypothetical protein